MDPLEAKRIALETLDKINEMLSGDANALVCSRSGEVSPEASYVELVREILELAKIGT